MAEPPFDLEPAHRWFAVECNNRAWDLIESSHRDEASAQEAVHLAHAALWHWSRVGSPVHRQRALHLLAHAYAMAKRCDEADRYARECLTLSEANGEEQSAFDRATALEIAARAASLCGRRDEADELKRRAREAGERIEREEDRDYFLAMLDGGEWGATG